MRAKPLLIQGDFLFLPVQSTKASPPGVAIVDVVVVVVVVCCCLLLSLLSGKIKRHDSKNQLVAAPCTLRVEYTYADAEQEEGSNWFSFGARKAKQGRGSAYFNNGCTRSPTWHLSRHCLRWKSTSGNEHVSIIHGMHTTRKEGNVYV